jgi:hypothetical protein
MHMRSSVVDNTKMGPYRAPTQRRARVITPRGATLTKILERAWDKGEDYGGDTALSKANRSLFEEIDKAMDQFINLLLAHPSAAPDQARLKAAYSTYLEKLKRAD